MDWPDSEAEGSRQGNRGLDESTEPGTPHRDRSQSPSHKRRRLEDGSAPIDQQDVLTIALAAAHWLNILRRKNILLMMLAHLLLDDIPSSISGNVPWRFLRPRHILVN